MIKVVAAIIHKDNKIIISKRKENKSMGGFWEFPGGKIEQGETPEEGLVRELKEEMNISIKVEKYVGESIYDYGNIVICLLGYLASIENGHIILKDHDAYEWVTLEEISKFKLAPADIPLVKILQEGDYGL
ncbi:MAG: (deoxy)nucleoside triphosphate pyrophosphohydrolase [Solirubrobacterales bacterium]